MPEPTVAVAPEVFPDVLPEDVQEPTEDGLIQAIVGRPLGQTPNLDDDARCTRCERKNDVRRRYDIDERDPLFNDGERVRIIATYAPRRDDGIGWSINAAFHTDHAMRSKEEIASFGVAQAQATVKLAQTGFGYRVKNPTADSGHIEFRDDTMIVRDPQIEWFVAPSAGTIDEPDTDADTDSDDDDEHPPGTDVLEPTDPRPYWPDEVNDWREQLMRKHDDWNDDVPTYGLNNTAAR